MKTLTLVLAGAVLAACSSASYRPVQDTDFDRLTREGCTRSNDRFSVTAKVSSASRETIVLWDGFDSSRTVAVRLPRQGVATRIRGWFGKNRYELSFERLEQLRSNQTPVTLAMRCDAPRMAPIADRYSYFDNGRLVQFEF